MFLSGTPSRSMRGRSVRAESPSAASAPLPTTTTAPLSAPRGDPALRAGRRTRRNRPSEWEQRDGGGGGGPRIVTPTNRSSSGSLSSASSAAAPTTASPFSLSGLASTAASPSASWEDFDEGLVGSMTRKARRFNQNNSRIGAGAGGGGAMGNISRGYSFSGDEDHPALGRRFEGYNDDMPMDEMADTTTPAAYGDANLKRSIGTSHSFTIGDTGSRPTNVPSRHVPVKRQSMPQHPEHPGLRSTSFDATTVTPTSNLRPPMVPSVLSAVDSADRGGGCVVAHTVEDDISSLGGVEDHAFGRMMIALRNRSTARPANLSLEERTLWDCIQQTVHQIRTEQNSKVRSLERHMQDLSRQLPQQPTSSATPPPPAVATNEAQSSMLQKQQEKISQLQERLKESEQALKVAKEEHDSEVRAIQRVLADVTTGHEEEAQESNDRAEELESQVESLQADKSQLENDLKMAKEEMKTKLEQQAEGLRADLETKPRSESPFMSEEEAEQLRQQADQADELQKNLDEALDALAEATSTSDDLTEKLDQTARRLSNTEKDFKAAKSQLIKKEKECSKLIEEIESMKQSRASLALEVESKNKQILTLEKRLQAANEEVAKKVTKDVPVGVQALSSDEADKLKRELSDTTASLENAKMIIASLQNANGSLAVELRAKLKSKEDELLVVQSESADRKRRLDSLATELRDIQMKQGELNRVAQRSNNQVFREKALLDHLRASLAELQSASVVHEVSSDNGMTDSANIDKISSVLGDMLVAIKSTMEQTEEYIEESVEEQSAIGTDVDSEVGRHIDALIRSDREAAAKEIRQELDDKILEVKHLQESLARKDSEMKRMKSELETRWDQNGGNESVLKREIQSLRDQCATNMEVLAKKERELSVLRSSLSMDEDDVGYISDDGSEGDDEDGDESAVSSPPRLNGYDSSQTEALATLMSHSDPNASTASRSAEVEAMRKELIQSRTDRTALDKSLQAERISLANAKMIISSLEQANKSMMEDLRSRLHESNSAIANLLEKSNEHKTTTSELQAELEALRREREAERRKHQAELESLRSVRSQEEKKADDDDLD